MMFKSKCHSAILTSILDSAIELTTSLLALLEIIPTTLSHECALLLDTKTNLIILSTNLKYLHVRVASAFKNDNELFLEVIQILESDVLPIINQCFHLLKYVSRDFDMEEVLTLKKLFDVVSDLSTGDSMETLISEFALFLMKCLSHSVSTLNVDCVFEDSYSSDVLSFDEGKEKFEYEMEYYSLASKINTINDLLKDFELCLEDLKESETECGEVADDIFGFEMDETPCAMQTNYCLNYRRKVSLY